MTQKGNEIGARLRALRENEELSVRVLAQILGCAPSYVSKMETGALRPSDSYIRRVKSAISIPEAEFQTLLSLLALFETEHYPVINEEGALEKRQRAILHLETSAKSICTLQTVVIPGLLQIPEYASIIFREHPRVVLGCPTPSAKRVQASVRQRLRRQQVLEKMGKRFTFVLLEGALRMRLGPNQIMMEQVEQIGKLAQKANVTIKIVPATTVLPVVTPSGFSIHDDTLVIVDTVNGYVSFRNPNDVKTYVRVFQELESCAVGGSEMRDLLASIAREFATA